MNETIINYVYSHQAEVRLYAAREAFCRNYHHSLMNMQGISQRFSLLLATRLIKLGNEIISRLQPTTDTITQTIDLAIFMKKEAL